LARLTSYTKYSLLSALCTISHQRTAFSVLQSMYRTNLFIFLFLSVNEHSHHPHTHTRTYSIIYRYLRSDAHSCIQYITHTPCINVRYYNNGSHIGFFSRLFIYFFFFLHTTKKDWRDDARAKKTVWPFGRQQNYGVRWEANNNVIIMAEFVAQRPLVCKILVFFIWNRRHTYSVSTALIPDPYRSFKYFTLCHN